MTSKSITPATVLVVNAGSTSTKLSVVGDDTSWDRSVPAGAEALAAVLNDVRDEFGGVAAVGHRIVHGGSRFVEPVLVDDDLLAAIEEVSELAPLHNRAGLDGIAAARATFPGLPHVACFDTAFHATMTPAAQAYGGPRAWLERGYRRYGFHGLSHQYAAERAAELLGRPAGDLRVVSCHLGGGSSCAAISEGRSIDTTMGFTPLDGLVMSTRSGAIDPGLVLHLLRQGVGVDELDEMLEHRSGVLGLSGVSGDLRDVLAARDEGNADARLAIDVFVHRLRSGIGAMIAAMNGLDAVVFTGGIGEHSPEIRARAMAGFAWLGALVDPEANATVNAAVSVDARPRGPADLDIATPAAAIRILTVASREDLVIARATRSLVGRLL